MSKGSILRVPDYLEHIVNAIERIHRYVDDVSEVHFLTDDKTQDAVIRNFEIIGEASHNIERHHPGYGADHPEVPWSLMYTMRNRVAHGYFQVDFELVWKTIHTDLPSLREDILKLLAGLQ